jgi:hypothetical protein
LAEESLAKRVHISSPSGCSEPIESDFSNDVEVLDVFCQGERGLWSIGDNNSLDSHPISKRVAMSKEGISTYIMCSCVSKLPQGGTGCFGVFRPKASTTWHLAIVQSFFYQNYDGTDTIHLLEWTGSLSSVGSPQFYNSTSWEELRGHFTERIFDLNEIDFFFVNKVRGVTFPNFFIPDDTRSHNDHGIQCNPNGPDRVPPSIIIPVDRGNDKNLSLSTLSISSKDGGFLQKNAMKSTIRQQTRKRKSNSPQSDLSKAWTKPPPRIPKVDSTLCAVIISKSNGQMLDSDELRSLGDAEGLFIFPSPLASGNMSNVQKFYGVAQSDYGNVVDRIDGISPEEAENVLAEYSTSEHEHVLCNVTSLHPQGPSEGSYLYTKVFIAGEFSPSISSTDQTTINLPAINRRVNFTFAPARSYHEFIPLSVSIVDPTLHGYTITNSIIQRIVLAVGKNGLFTRRSRSAHHGSLSFIGRRSLETVAQPNPSEGDISSFWYYRQHINFCWWPLLLKVINALTSNLKMLPQHEFFHLTKLLPHLFPHVFTNGLRDFCLFAILTINFLNCIHVDVGDKLGPEVDEQLIEELETLMSN